MILDGWNDQTVEKQSVKQLLKDRCIPDSDTTSGQRVSPQVVFEFSITTFQVVFLIVCAHLSEHKQMPVKIPRGKY